MKNKLIYLISMTLMLLVPISGFAGLPGDSIYNLNSTLLNSQGNEVKLSELEGKPVVISMAYTGCTYTCPLILSQMQQLEKELQKKGKKDVFFILVSFDTENDTPATIKKYQEKKKLSSQWRIYTGKTDKPVREVANVLGIKYKKVEDGYFDHSFVITVLDSQGVIQGQQIGADKNPKDLEAYIK